MKLVYRCCIITLQQHVGLVDIVKRSVGRRLHKWMGRNFRQIAFELERHYERDPKERTKSKGKESKQNERLFMIL